ncbi:hypothetical protein PC113_g20351 [Phytophthora cactorum]|uniref:Uncharacterized protein n=1 Tax=Phytophthora cactorum TaxID=29920 RepID=A0A8T0YAP2_9STRA|nr:hypothetical protein PC113_g20351 [Phytophthora cactorum]
MIPMAPNLRSVSEASPAEGQRLSIRLDSKLNQVVPVGSRNKRPDSTTKRHLRGTPNQKLSCSEAFGSLGIPMALILVLCLVWTAWLLVVSLEPNKAANWLMDTRTYDNGQFWLIIDSNPELTRVGVASLMFVVFCYLFNVYTKSVDLVMQTIVLLQLLNRGSPVEIGYGYTCFVALNSLSCATNIFSAKFSALTEFLIDSIFDLSAAVLFPIITLVFCSYNFEFDRDVYLTYLEKLVPGSFEYTTRLFADQSEIKLFRVSFDSLRFSSRLDLVLVDFTMMSGIICCNGFIGACDLTDFFCLGNPFFGVPPVICLVNDTNPTLPVTPYLGSASTQEAFQKFAPNACDKWATGADGDAVPTPRRLRLQM